MSRRTPHDRCAVCDRPLDETGGVRLIATPSHSLSICTPHLPLGSIRHPARTIRLRGNLRDVIVVFSGEHLWTDQVVRRAESICYAGRRPWFCQRCGQNSLCPRCDTPLTTAPATDHLDDDGRIVHSAWFVGLIRECPNPECVAHRTGVRDEEVIDWINDIPYDPELSRRVDELLSSDDEE